MRNIFRSASPPKFGAILIVTYGRSGSTLLQGILNSSPGVIIRGENMNICFHLFKSYQAILEAQKMGGAVVENPYYGAAEMDENQYVLNLKKTIKELLVPGDTNSKITHYGFKEIRYPYVKDQLEEYLNFLKMLFPNPCFIFNTRGLENVAKSDWWAKKTKEEVFEFLGETEKRFMEFEQKNRDCSFHIRYEEIIAKSPRLEELFSFLEIPYDSNQISRVLDKPHSVWPKGK